MRPQAPGSRSFHFGFSTGNPRGSTFTTESRASNHEGEDAPHAARAEAGTADSSTADGPTRNLSPFEAMVRNIT